MKVTSRYTSIIYNARVWLFFALVMFFNAFMDFKVWFDDGRYIPSWVASVAWVVLGLVAYCISVGVLEWNIE